MNSGKGRAKAGSLLAFALALTLFVAGCGGDDTGTVAASTPSLTKAEFVKRGNAICRRGQKEMAKLDEAAWRKYDSARANPSQTILNKVALALLPPREKELRLLRSLAPPAGDEGYIDEMLTAWEEGIETGKEEPASLRGAGRVYAFQTSHDMGIDYGLVDCWLD